MDDYASYGSTSAAEYNAGAYLADGSSGAGASSDYYASSSYGGVGAGGFQGSSSSNFESGFEQAGLASASSNTGASYETSSFEQQSSTSARNYATDAQGLYQDSNPQIIRRPAPGGAQTFTQRVVVRFLQPPPIPPPGVSISNLSAALDMNEELTFLPC